MKYLVFCSCAHALDRHGPAGCAGDGHMPCACRNDQERALDSAIEHARSHPWGVSRPDAPLEHQMV